MNIEQGDKWCSCDKQGTCLGCLIEKEVIAKFGKIGLRHLHNNLQGNVNDRGGLVNPDGGDYPLKWMGKD